MRLFLICALLFRMANVFSQEFAAQWISHPEPDDTTSVWFRRTYWSYSMPEKASVSILSTGLYALYVNGRNVTSDVLLPLSGSDEEQLTRINYDISRFLRPYRNTIAVWYAPGKSPSRKQLSVCYYGEDSDGELFSHMSDNSWLCKPSNVTCSPTNGETANARRYDPDWKDADTNTATWVPAALTNDTASYDIEEVRGFFPSLHVNRILTPQRTEEDSLGVVYDFGREFEGWIRVTLRNAKKGEVIQIGSLTYICDGTMDEQACLRFSVEKQKEVRIRGDRFFQRKQIQTVEGLEIRPHYHHSFLY